MFRVKKLEKLKIVEHFADRTVKECTVVARFRFPLSTKLISLIAALLVLSITTLVWFSTRLFIADNTALIQQMNADTATHLALQMRGVLVGLTENMRILGMKMLENAALSGAKSSLSRYFEDNPSVSGLLLYEQDGSGKPQLTSFEVSSELSLTGEKEDVLASLRKEGSFSTEQLLRGQIQLVTMALSDGNLRLVIGLPFIKRTNDELGFSHGLVGLLNYKKLLGTFGDSDLSLSFLIDGQGRLVAHPELDLVVGKKKMTHLEIVRQFLSGKFGNGQRRFWDPQAKAWKLGAFRAVGFAGLGVVTEVPEAKAFEAARRVEYRAGLIAAIVLCVCFLLGYLFSGTITSPLGLLVGATNRIADGDFKIRIQPKTRDEVADLAIAFNQMAKGLEERDRIKDTFNKFHSKEIADRLLGGQVNLGGERRIATVLFTDIRSFTSMSEVMDPARVVDLLNEYLSRMVATIRKYGGVVDKYVGDAIMAVWGVPIERIDDTHKAVAACLAMRLQLAKLNQLRVARHEAAIMIGMGLNFGEVVAGNIGSTERMEYTVIGDTVNVASRIESMTKHFGCDLLVSASVVHRVEKHFVFEKCGDAMVKGKSRAIEMYRVAGIVDKSGHQVIVKTQYSDYVPAEAKQAA